MNTKGKMHFDNKPKPKVQFLGYNGISGTASFLVNGTDVTIDPPTYDDEGHKLPYRVVWSGAVDFEGNKRDLLKRYPEFKGYV